MKKFGFVLLAVASAGLVSTAIADAPGAVSGLQVSFGDCLVAVPKKPSTGTKGALDAIAGAVISQGVNYIGKALTAAGSAKTWTMTGARNFEATSGTFPECIVVVRSTFAMQGGPISNWTPPEQWPVELQDKLQKRGIWSTRAPDFLFEGQVIAAKDQSALTIRPAIVSYLNPIGTRFLRPNTDRHVALFFSITPPGTKPTLETSPAATIVLGSMATGTTARFDPNQSYSSPYESPWFTLTKSDSIKPLTVTAMLSETQDAQAFLTFLGSVFSDPKVVAAANTELSQILIPNVAASAAADATAKAATQSNDADTKFSLAIGKLAACKNADATGAVSAGAEARTALRNYVVADGASPAPQNDVAQALIDKIDLRQKADAIKAACVEILAGLTK